MDRDKISASCPSFGICLVASTAAAVFWWMLAFNLDVKNNASRYYVYSEVYNETFTTYNVDGKEFYEQRTGRPEICVFDGKVRTCDQVGIIAAIGTFFTICAICSFCCACGSIPKPAKEQVDDVIVI
jgi:hypothetical protein